MSDILDDMLVYLAIAIAIFLCSMNAAVASAERRTILLIGSNDAARQLVGNSLLSIIGSHDAPSALNVSYPFSSRPKSSETYCSAYINDDQLVVIDGFGLGNRKVDQNLTLRLLQKSLAAVANQIHLVLVVFRRRDIVNGDLLAYIHLFNERVLKQTRAETISANVAFVCDEDAPPSNDNNAIHLNHLLAMIERKRLFSFDFLTIVDNYETSSSLFGKRSLQAESTGKYEMSQRLIAFADEKATAALDLAHVQDERFVAKMARDSHALFANASIDGTKQKRHVIVVGFEYAGKSIVANCLFNRRGTLYHVKQYPFQTGEIFGCTSKATIMNNDEFVIVDTVGFGDPQFDEPSVIEEFNQGFALLDNKVDLVLFVMQPHHFIVRLDNFFEHIHKKVFKRLMYSNSVLLCSDCPKGWLADTRRDSDLLNRMLNVCSNRSFEFSLNLHISDIIKMPPALRDHLESIFEQSRQKEIDALVAYLNGLNLRRTDLFKEHISLKLIKENGAELARPNLLRRFVDTLVSTITFNDKSHHSAKAKALDKKCLVSFQFEVAPDAN